MSAVTSVNPGIANLSQLLSSTGSASISSALSSPTVQSALNNAPPADLVQLSQQAVQLQEASGLFGSSDSSDTAATPQTLLLQALNSAITGSAATGSTTSTSTASTAAATSALEQVSELLGTNSSSGSVSFLG